MFADDTNIFFSSLDDKDLINTVNTERHKIKIWMDANKLSLNINKRKATMFGNYKTNLKSQIVVDDIQTEYVLENKFLGVITDSKLSRNVHITHTKKKMASRF